MITQLIKPYLRRATWLSDKILSGLFHRLHIFNLSYFKKIEVLFKHIFICKDNFCLYEVAAIWVTVTHENIIILIIDSIPLLHQPKFCTSESFYSLYAISLIIYFIAQLQPAIKQREKILLLFLLWILKMGNCVRCNKYLF